MSKIIVFITVIAIVGGALYYLLSSYWPSSLPLEQEGLQQTDEFSALESVSGATDTTTVDEELQATDISDLDKEFSDIDSELEAALNEAL